MSQADAASLAKALRALADPSRLRMLSLLSNSEGLESCGCDLLEPLGLSQSTVSHHFKVLTDAGLVVRDKRGVWVHYSVVPKAVAQIARRLASI